MVQIAALILDTLFFVVAHPILAMLCWPSLVCRALCMHSLYVASADDFVIVPISLEVTVKMVHGLAAVHIAL